MSKTPAYLSFVSYPSKLRSINNISFTEREIDIISGISSGKSVGTISKYLNIASKTVEAHTSRIMLKLARNSRDRVISFMEETKTIEAFYHHYLQLLLRYTFSEHMKKIARITNKEPIFCAIILRENIENKNEFLKQIHSTLLEAGINVKLAESENEDLPKNHKPIILSTDLTQKEKDKNEIINLEQQQSFYHIVLAILHKIIDHKSLKDITIEFQKEFDLFQEESSPLIKSQNDKLSNKYITKLKIFPLSVAFIILCSIAITAFYYQNGVANQKPYIRSDLIIPVKTAFLERPEIIKKMNDRLTEDGGIQTIALTGIVGIGGAGKTTLARYFAKSLSNVPIVWELNAESKDTLINSFRDLAYVLADTTELKKDLDFIQRMQDPEMQEKLLLNFIKIRLKERSEWILIYDNIETFSQINHLVPHNPEQWGNGKVIITTRNEHIAETSHIKPESIIHVDELSDAEMLSLFTKILYDIEPDKLPEKSHDMSVDFLKKIPPFPLDVSVAAYSIKNTHVTLEQYLRHINEYSKNYETMQLKLLKEATVYDKTRYGIISSTVEKLNKIRPNFQELFFFICLLDSQNISHKLLESYNNTKTIDDLIYNLRQNGLLLRESYSNFDQENKVISLHRSTQEIGAAFLTNSLTEKEKEYLIGNMINSVNKFYESCVKNGDINNITLLIPHLNALLNNIHSLNISQEAKNKYEADLYLTLGYIHYDSKGIF